MEKMKRTERNKKSLIGIVPLMDYDKESYWMLPGYMQGIEEAGGIPVMLPLTEDEAVLKQLADLCGGFLLTGGQDVSPGLYGEQKLAECGECCPERDRMEAFLLHEAIRQDKSVLGICRGIQFMNAALGGSLYQDIPSQYPTDVQHHQSPPYDDPVHEVELIPGTPLHSLLGLDRLRVNSYHHQAVKRLSERLKVMAVSEDGLTEGVYMPDRKWIWAVQWHPELAYRSDENSRKIFRAFVESIRSEK